MAFLLFSTLFHWRYRHKHTTNRDFLNTLRKHSDTPTGHLFQDTPCVGITLQSSEVTCSIMEARLHPSVTAPPLVYHTRSQTFQRHFRGKRRPVRAGLDPTLLNHDNWHFQVSVISIYQWTIRQQRGFVLKLKHCLPDARMSYWVSKESMDGLWLSTVVIN